MEEKLRKYVESLFEKAPKTQKAIELRQEIISNLLDKYNDLKSSGASEEEAYEIVVKGLGNVDELINGLADKGADNNDENIENRKKHAMLNAVAVALYIASPIFIIGFSAAGYWLAGIVLLLSCIAVATGIKVYSNSVYKNYQKMDDTLVEEFKEWKAETKDKEQRKNVYSSVLWLFIVALYIVISFSTMAWHITWVLFLIGAAADQLIKINVQK